METELKDLVTTKDVIVLTSLEEPAVSWLIDCYQENTDIDIIKNAHQLEAEEILAQCRNSLSESKRSYSLRSFAANCLSSISLHCVMNSVNY